MIRIKDVLKELEQYAPLPLQESFDNAGVQVGDVNQLATGALLPGRYRRGGRRGDRNGV